MIAWFIIGCEIAFWIFILAGLTARYIFKMKRTSAVLLILTPVTDLFLLTATVIDLKNGTPASAMHGLAAIYLGVSIVYGHRMIKWADRQFEYRFAGGVKPVKRKTYGMERAREERIGWYLHLLAWMIGCGFLWVMIVLVEGPGNILHFFREIMQGAADAEPPSTFALLRTIGGWTVILVIDFLISFSYTVFPTSAPKLSEKHRN